MKIPKQIKLGGQVINVIFDDEMCSRDSVLGQCDNNHNKIILAKNIFGDSIPEDRIERTLYHEITHWILFNCGEEELYKDEKFVDRLSLFIQELVTQNKL